MGLKALEPLSRRPAPHCRRCAGWRAAKSVCCSGRGMDGVEGPYPKRLDILFVGEMPGKDEDAAGRCFVGPSGGLLDCFMEHYLKDDRGRWRWTWEISNSVRCYLGLQENKKPVKPSAGTKKEPGPFRACRNFLVREIEELKPRVVVAMGAYAIAQVLGVWVNDITVEKLLCWPRATDWPGTTLFPVNHPAWAMRRGISDRGEGPGKDEWEKQWEKLVCYLEGKLKDDFPGEFTWLGGMGRKDTETLIEKLVIPCGDIAFDYETTGLDPRKDDFRMVGYGYGGRKSIVMPLEEEWQLDLHGHVLRSARSLHIHHWGMELPWTQQKLGFLPEALFYDTKALDFLVDENEGKRLKDLVERWLPEFSGFKRRSESLEVKLSEAPDGVLAERCGLDCIVTRELSDILWEKLTGRQQELYEEDIEPFLRSLALMRVRGWHFDRSRLDALMARAEKRVDEIREELLAIPEAQDYFRDLKAMRKKFSPNSNQMVPDLLKALRVDDGRDRQVNDPTRMRCAKEVFEKRTKTHKVFPLVTEYRSMARACSTFLGPIIAAVERDGCVYPNYNWGGAAVEDDPAGTGTGRVSCGKPNLANLPSPKNPDLPPLMREIRTCVVSRFKGGRILSADLDQGELRAMACLSGEESLLGEYRRAWKEGGKADIHQAVADQIGKDRYSTKTVNFMTGYGAAAQRVARELDITEDAASELLALWWESKPDLQAFFAKVKRVGYEQGWYEGPLGMRVHVPDLRSHDRQVADHAARRVGNYPVQNMISMLCNIAQGRIEKRLEGKRSVLFGNLYDGLYIDLHPDDDEKGVMRIVREEMHDRIFERFGSWLLVPVPVDIKVSDTMTG